MKTVKVSKEYTEIMDTLWDKWKDANTAFDAASRNLRFSSEQLSELAHKKYPITKKYLYSYDSKTKSLEILDIKRVPEIK